MGHQRLTVLMVETRFEFGTRQWRARRGWLGFVILMQLTRAAGAQSTPAPPAGSAPSAPSATFVPPAGAAPAVPPARTPAEQQADGMRRMQESIAQQKAAVRKQMGFTAAAFGGVPWVGPAVGSSVATASAAAVPSSECDPIPEPELSPLIASAATANKLKPELLRAIIRHESASRPCAVSAKGAMGLMQLMPETAEELQVADPFDPAQNIQSGARYLKQLLERFQGDLKLSLAAYNAGPSRITGNAIPDIPETRSYIQKIISEVEKISP